MFSDDLTRQDVAVIRNLAKNVVRLFSSIPNKEGLKMLHIILGNANGADRKKAVKTIKSLLNKMSAFVGDSEQKEYLGLFKDRHWRNNLIIFQVILLSELHKAGWRKKRKSETQQNIM